MSMVLSRKRTALPNHFLQPFVVHCGRFAAGRRTNLARLMDPRLQASMGRRGCSPQGLVLSMFPRPGVGLSRLIRSKKTIPGSPVSQAWFTRAVKDLRRLQLAAFLLITGIDQIIRAIGFDRLHECFCQAHRDIEIVQLTVILLAGDKFHDVWVVHPQDGHVGAPAGTPLLDLLGGRVEDSHEGDRA